jgi:5'-3' exoribonuclease 2
VSLPALSSRGRRYFPFHYAPFASDLVNIDDFSIDFELGQPFTPLEQLMGVFPARRYHFLRVSHCDAPR